MRAAALLLVLSAIACQGRGDAPEIPAPEGKNVTGSLSPAGDRHPGKIEFDDKVDKRQWTERAGEVPQMIAWDKSEGGWVPVVRIEITGIPKRREMKYFGPNGRFLRTSIQGPPRRRKP